ncbi:transposase [Streptomyces phaeochromogenes]|uniref:transposase n=1 Tax=Streptomyces phaeochromogenes TaxID=1923 RepID=UPI003684550A
MSDAEWFLMRDLLPVPGCLAGRDGQPESYCRRQMIYAERYLVDNGIKWRAGALRLPSLAARVRLLRQLAGHGAGGRTA